MIETNCRSVVVLFAAIAASPFAGSFSFAAQSVPVPAPNTSVDPLDIPQADLSGVEPSVQKQIRAAQATLARASVLSDASRASRAEAFGKLGQIYQAYGFESAALACYTNAARLDSQSFRWSYYAGYLGQQYGDAETAERDYLHALALKPNDSSTLLRLGYLELILGRPGAARQYFTRAVPPQGASAAASTGLGKVALAEHHYSDALKYFTDALEREPKASSLHYQLALAYRGLGDLAHMREQLQLRGDVEPTIQDPLLDEIDALKLGKFGLLERANTAMQESRFADAVDIYRQMVSLDASDPLTYKYLGLALAKSGKPAEALGQYKRSLELDPNNATVHYNIGVLQIETGEEAQAIDRFQQAVRLDPGLVAAHFQLANLFMRKGLDAEAEREYGIAVALEPQNAFARFMQGIAAVHAAAYTRARKELEDAFEAFPGDTDIANALARLLAGSPDPSVRDAARALRLVGTLVDRQQGDPLEVGITFGMALAANGHFQDAVRYQEAIIQQLEASREYDLARPLRQNLTRYRQGKACLTPWASDDPVFTPTLSRDQLSIEAKTMGRQ